MRRQEWRKKRSVIRHYDRLADVYDHLYSNEQNLKIRLALNAIQTNDSDLVLDAGCGTGLLLDHIKESVSLFVGIDLSRALLEAATKRIKGLSKGSSICLIRADVDYLPFQREVFDKVFAVTLLQNMPDSNQTLREILRVAKRGFTIVVTGLKKSFSKEEFANILSRAGLKFSLIDGDEQVRCHIAICRKDTV